MVKRFVVKQWNRYGQKACVAVLVVACTTSSVLAQFGGISVDPVQSGHAVIQIGQAAKQITQGINMIQNAEAIARTTLSTYELYQFERMSLQNRQGWIQALTVLGNDVTPNLSGGTAGWAGAMNGNLGAIPAAYQAATVALQNPVWARGYQNGTATVATIQIYDSAIQTAMAQVAQQRMNQQRNLMAQQNLNSQILNLSKAANTEAAQQNLTNGAMMQQVSTTQQIAQATTATNAMLLVEMAERRNEQTTYVNDITEAQAYFAAPVRSKAGGLQSVHQNKPW